MTRRRTPHPFEPEDIDPGFGHWLAGFADGEAHFGFVLQSGIDPRAQFILMLRADDQAILREIRDRLGIGTVALPKVPATSRRAKPAARYVVSGLHNCLWLARLFELYPLRARKRRDFEVWALAIRAVANGAGRNELAEYAERIRAVRQFTPDTSASGDLSKTSF